MNKQFHEDRRRENGLNRDKNEMHFITIVIGNEFQQFYLRIGWCLNVTASKTCTYVLRHWRNKIITSVRRFGRSWAHTFHLNSQSHWNKSNVIAFACVRTMGHNVVVIRGADCNFAINLIINNPIKRATRAPHNTQNTIDSLPTGTGLSHTHRYTRHWTQFIWIEMARMTCLVCFFLLCFFVTLLCDWSDHKTAWCVRVLGFP